MITSPPFLLRMAALTRLSDAEKKIAAAGQAKAEAGSPTCVSLALERSAIDDMRAASMYFDMASLMELKDAS